MKVSLCLRIICDVICTTDHVVRFTRPSPSVFVIKNWRRVRSGLVANRPFPLTSKYVLNTWCHIWGASEGLLGWILHCYIWERSLHSDSCCLRVQGNPKLPRRQPEVPALAFSTVVVELRATFFNTAVVLLDERVLCAPNGLWWLLNVY